MRDSSGSRSELVFASFSTVPVSCFAMAYRTIVFFSRVNELGLESFADKFREMGLTTYSKFAFGSEQHPYARPIGPDQAVSLATRRTPS